MWKSREESRVNSPDREVPSGRQQGPWPERPMGRSELDPVNTGLISLETCRTLYDLWVLANFCWTVTPNVLQLHDALSHFPPDRRCPRTRRI